MFPSLYGINLFQSSNHCIDLELRMNLLFCFASIITLPGNFLRHSLKGLRFDFRTKLHFLFFMYMNIMVYLRILNDDPHFNVRNQGLREIQR